ncbi:MAG: fructosamine kinase family protein [Gammaproteobacteria bacterium]
MYLDELIQEHTHQEINTYQSIGTGLFDSYKVNLKNNSNVFIKIQNNSNNDLIHEAEELRILGEHVNTPKVIASTNHCIILEWIEQSYNPSIQKELGRSLSELHLKHNDYFGFIFDNKIGSTPQKNATNKNIKNWADFYWSYRIKFQIDLAKKNNLLELEQYNNLMNLKDSIYRKLDIQIRPTLLHGDLWSGNYIATSSGPYFIDTASYYGHSEADFALTYMFGGFSKEFYQSYEKRSPFEENHEERKPIYMIYHYLNHLNLFGRSYLGGVLNCYQKIIN